MTNYLTFPEFQATKREVDDVGNALDFDYGDGIIHPGFIYADSYYIEKLTDNPRGAFYLLIDRSDWISDDLASLERILWAQHYLPETCSPDDTLDADGTLDDFVVGMCTAHGKDVDGDLFGVLFSGKEKFGVREARDIIMHARTVGLNQPEQGDRYYTVLKQIADADDNVTGAPRLVALARKAIYGEAS